MRSKTKVDIAIFACVFIYFIAQFSQTALQRLNHVEYNGVLTAFQFVICLISLKFDYKKGRISSWICIGYSVIQLTLILLLGKNISVLPGLVNSIIYIIAITILSYQFQIRAEESVTDLLTGLQNRRGLLKTLYSRIENKKPFYVVYIDLGNFKFINDNYGHTYGDQLLKLITKRISTVVDKNGTVSRIGGDEFVAVIDGKCDLETILTNMLDSLYEKVSLQLNNTKIDSYLTANMGVAKFPDDARNPDTLIKYADIAMYQATKSKTDRFKYFDQTMEQKFIRQMELEKLVNEALVHDYFYIDYQPQWKIRDKELRGFEALLRMKTPEGDLVSPKEFIPVAEKSELILQIDDYVLHRAMKEFKDIISFTHKDLTLSINVSASNIGDLAFINKIENYLSDTGFPPEKLEIEITEYCLVRSVETTIENIKKLHDMGIQVALDDFGTGYTSLSYLAKMPINLLKVDKSLIDDIETHQKSRDFVNAVISMGHLMGCKVISEGVENENQLSLMNQQGCDYVQGYVWSKPISYHDARDLALN